MVYRNDYECLDWWKLCGEFNITYPNYQHFGNIDMMWDHIKNENRDIMNFVKHHIDKISKPKNNHELCKNLNITAPESFQDYHQKDIKVYLYE